MIPGLSLFFMVVSAIISFGLPVVLILVWRKKYALKPIPVAVGAAAFVISVLILQRIMHIVVFRPNADGEIYLLNNPALYVLYGIFAAGIFEETARYISFRLIRKKYSELGTGIAYGIGHGGIEAILLVGMLMINNIVFSLLINTGNPELLGNDPNTLFALRELENTKPVMFIVSGLERIIAISVHISLSMLVWCSVKVKGKLWLYPAAIVLHAIVNIAPAMYQIGLLENVWLVEGLVALPAVLIAAAAYFVCKIIKREDDKNIEAVTEAAGEIEV